MVKKIIIRLLFLLAGISMLAYAAIPHHHHNKYSICFVTTHCSDNHVNENSEHRINAHNHDENTNAEKCLLKEIYVRPDNIRSSFDAKYISGIQYPLLLLLISDVFEYNIHTKDFFYHPKPSYLTSYLTEFISVSLGLRAPPFFITN